MNQKLKKQIELGIFCFLGLVFILSSSLFFYQLSYKNKIYPNVSAAGIDLSGKTKKQAAYLIQKKYDGILEQEFVLRTKDGEVKTKLADTGLSLDLNEVVNDSFRVGRDNNFFRQAYFSTCTLWEKQTVEAKPKIDQEKYDIFLKIAVAQLNSEPQDASLTIENGEIKTLQEKEGAVADTSNLMNRILNLAENSSGQNIVELATKAIFPSVRAADFQPATIFAQNILAKKITLTYEDKVFTPSRSDIGLWIAFKNTEGKYQAGFNENNMQAYLNKIAKSFEIERADKKINALDNSIIAEGRQGKYLDKKAAIGQLKNQLNSSTGIVSIALTTYTEEPKEIKVFPAEGLIPGRFPGKYVDVDLAIQRLCQVDGNNVLNCWSISSGKPGMPTPTGTFAVQNKNPRQFSSKYGLYMPWWQQFSGDYGLHELPETNTWKEVPDHLGTPVSHGCVRLGVGPAQELYNWTEIGTPVYIHK